MLALRMSMSVLVAVPVRGQMFMITHMIALAVVQALVRPWTTRIFAEHQRFNRDRHGVALRFQGRKDANRNCRQSEQAAGTCART